MLLITTEMFTVNQNKQISVYGVWFFFFTTLISLCDIFLLTTNLWWLHGIILLFRDSCYMWQVYVYITILCLR